MIVYDYKCKKCGGEYFYRADTPHQGEKLPCPACGSEDYEINESDSLEEIYSGCDSCSTDSFG